MIFFDFLAAMAITMAILSLAASGLISAEQAAMAIVGLFCFRILARITGGIISRLIRTTFTVAMPFFAVALFVVSHGNGDPEVMAAIFTSLISLLIPLLGIYIMLLPLLNRRRSR